MGKRDIDYSVYLVTGRELLPPGKDYLESLEESIQGGVTVVQVREKNADTGEFLEIAQKSQAICKKHNIPLIINDRIDIALAIHADGVHIGQTDMPISIARHLLPPDTIIGVTTSTPEQVQQAIKDGADYVGLGPVWGTKTKDVKNPPAGPRGIGELLTLLEGTDVKAVAIAGIKSSNALHCLHGSVSPGGRTLDGLAVVSEIVGSPEPFKAAKRLAGIIKSFKSSQKLIFSLGPGSLQTSSPSPTAGDILSAVRKFGPLVHQITNNVVTTQSANATLALGGSPIMATAPEEMEDLCKIPGALLVNFGTIQNLDGMLAAGRNANINKKPVVFDPVGVGATQFRRSSAKHLLDSWQATVIKGNAGELAALANSNEVQAKGVDSVGKGFADPAGFVRNLARKQRAIIVLTGKDDYVSDGFNVIRLSNGHPLLGDITGSGCMVGTAVATFCAGASMAETANLTDPFEEDGKLARGDMFLAAASGVLALTIASEFAAVREDVKGSGTFLPALIDELGKLTPEKFVERAKIEIL
ncbi:Hydroxyethylthiazole kinase [Panus rudis PR-1116 ss-1]|nr:Hydroxyethylthiazole kinase [Panus rudis PR-1116 ss-1]